MQVDNARDGISVIKLWSEDPDRFKVADVAFDGIAGVVGFGGDDGATWPLA